MKRTLLLVAGVAGLLIGLGFILPAVDLWRRGTPNTAMVYGPLLLGLLLIAAALLAARKGLTRPQA